MARRDLSCTSELYPTEVKNLKLADVFSNHMVLQQGKPIRIFGKGEGALRVTLAETTRTVSSVNGSWLAVFDAMPCGGPYSLTVESGDATVTLTDIMVGEVLLCTGQSNMQFHLSSEITPPEQYVTDPMMRTLVCHSPDNGEHFEPADGWQLCERETAGWWSAIGYHTALELRRSRGCAVGVIACSQGASIIQSWIDEDVYESSYLYDPTVVPFHNEHDPDWYCWNEDGLLYHSMLEPLIPFSVGSVLWYQGESNTYGADPEHYCELLAMLIGSWRVAMGDPTLKFYVIQLADFDGAGDKALWNRVKEEQLRAERVIPCTRTVICADICETDDVHPKTKYKLARRLAEAMEEA